MQKAIALVLFLTAVSALPKDYFEQKQFFGLPTETATVVLEDNQFARAPSSVAEHLQLWAEEDGAIFNKFWELLLPKTGISSPTSWHQSETQLPSEGDQDSEHITEDEAVLPDIKIVKYELPSLPELEPFNLPPLPDFQLPELKVIKYELPSLEELKPIELLPLPDIKLPDFKLIKYEMPPLPELTLPELPQLEPLQFPDLNIIKYELPDLDIEPIAIPPLPEISLPDWKIIKYELPPLPETTPIEFPQFPDVQLPELKILKYELPPLPELKPLKLNLWPKGESRVSGTENLQTGHDLGDQIQEDQQTSLEKEQTSNEDKEEQGNIITETKDSLADPQKAPSTTGQLISSESTISETDHLSLQPDKDSDHPTLFQVTYHDHYIHPENHESLNIPFSYEPILWEPLSPDYVWGRARQLSTHKISSRTSARKKNSKFATWTKANDL